MFKEILATYLFTKLIGKKKTKKINKIFQRYTLRIAAVVFGLISIAFSIQFAFSISVIVAGWSIPLWLGLIITIITGYLAFSLSKVCKN